MHLHKRQGANKTYPSSFEEIEQVIPRNTAGGRAPVYATPFEPVHARSSSSGPPSAPFIPPSQAINAVRNNAARDYTFYLDQSAVYATRSNDLARQGKLQEAAEAQTMAAKVLTDAKVQFETMRPVYDKMTGWERKYAESARSLSNRAQMSGAATMDAVGPGAPPQMALNNAMNVNAAAAADEAMMLERPDTRYDDVIGADEAKEALQEALELPRRVPQLFAAFKAQPWRGILLFGPPGTGKTMLAKAVAGENAAAFFVVKGSNILNHLVGQSEKRVAEVFKRAAEAGNSIIFFDECDQLLRDRNKTDESEAVRRTKIEFMTAMQGIATGSNVTVIAATNCPGDLDPAFLRRFQRKVWVGWPDEPTRAALFAAMLDGLPHRFSDADYADFAVYTAGYTPADIETALNDVKMMGIRRIVDHEWFKVDRRGIWYRTTETDPARQALPEDCSRLEFGDLQLTCDDVIAALKRNPPSLTAASRQPYIDYYASISQE